MAGLYGLKKAAPLFETLAKKLGIYESVKLLKLREDWEAIYPPPLSTHMEPIGIDKGVLIINVDSSAWLHELYLQRARLLEKLAAYDIRSIKLRYGKVLHRQKKDVKETGNPRELDSETIGFIDELSDKINDEELRAALKRAAKRSLSHVRD